MTDTTVNEPAKPTHVQIDPMAAASEAMALNEFYKNRLLLQANTILELSRTIDQLRAQLSSMQANANEGWSDVGPGDAV